MATTVERLQQLVDDNLEIPGRTQGQPLDPNSGFQEYGVSSMELVAFARLVAQEFGVTFTPADCVEISSVGQLVQFIDARSG